ncbi:unnamed protein product [Arctia plantaginis]|uniref:Uncharacterized protein n=1 Tax=Arctia plantaginis TaxID=874455 RepID=A0A8S0Z642_ARCPL|nr:unnamed protein product [Arctia plantaginis]
MLTLYYLIKKSGRKTKRGFRQYYENLTVNKGVKIKEDRISKCRVCLQEGSIPLYGQENTPFVLETLQSISTIQLIESDEYPKYLCNVCNEFVLSAILFKEQAVKTDKILKNPVKQETFIDQYSEQDCSDNSEYDAKPTEKESKCEIKKEKKVKIKYAAKVTCNICNKVINRSYYKEHMTMHDPDHKKYVCDVCGKSFRLRCAYHNHSLRHRNDFPHKCQYCPYKARYLELLKTHMRTHTGDYRYMCTECPARFLFKSNLNSHMLKHKEPQFKCDACKRAFHTKLMLQRHFEADHLGIKNHVCNLCGKAFGYRNAMMKHQRHVHKREKMLFGRKPAYLEAEHRNEDG